jgi:hypothetical protein
MHHVQATITHYSNAQARNQAVGLSALRALAHDPACKFYAHDGNDYLIVETELAGAPLYTLIVLTNLIDIGAHNGMQKVETGLGDVIALFSTGIYHEALAEALQIMKDDAGLHDE